MVTVLSPAFRGQKSDYFSQKQQAQNTQRTEKLVKIEQQIREHFDLRPKRNYPTIYYGTRTHRQIKQITKELGRTKYANTKMTVLGSRTQYCINTNAKKSKGGVNEGCSALLAGKG